MSYFYVLLYQTIFVIVKYVLDKASNENGMKAGTSFWLARPRRIRRALPFRLPFRRHYYSDTSNGNGNTLALLAEQPRTLELSQKSSEDNLDPKFYAAAGTAPTYSDGNPMKPNGHPEALLDPTRMKSMLVDRARTITNIFCFFLLCFLNILQTVYVYRNLQL